MPEQAHRIPVEIARVVDGTVRIDPIVVEDGTTLQQALEQAVRTGLVNAGELPALFVGVHGRRLAPDERLHPHDRIELTAALTVDPKIARQRRVAKRRAALPRDRWSPGR